MSEKLLADNDTIPHQFELTFVHNCVEDILELICTDLHVLTRRGVESHSSSVVANGAEALQNKSQLSVFAKPCQVVLLWGGWGFSEGVT